MKLIFQVIKALIILVTTGMIFQRCSEHIMTGTSNVSTHFDTLPPDGEIRITMDSTGNLKLQDSKGQNVENAIVGIGTQIKWLCYDPINIEKIIKIDQPTRGYQKKVFRNPPLRRSNFNWEVTAAGKDNDTGKYFIRWKPVGREATIFDPYIKLNPAR